MQSLSPAFLALLGRRPTSARSRNRRRTAPIFEGLGDRILFTGPGYALTGLDFSPYIAPGENPNLGPGQITGQELVQRMQALTPYTHWIRTFSCTGDLANAGAIAHGLGLKAAVGAWIGPNNTPAGEEANQAEIDSLVAQAIEGNVDLAIVGSEALLRGDVSKDSLVGYIDQVRSRLAASSVAIPVATADVYSVFLNNPDLIAHVDRVFANFYPFWEGSALDVAVARLDRSYQQLSSLAGTKPVQVSEAGWPSAGQSVGDAVPSPANAAAYFENFVSWARAKDVTYFYFEAYDEPWKTTEGPVGPHWGIFDSNGVLKPGMGRVFNNETVPDNWSNPASGPPIIDFAASPRVTNTNLDTSVVAGTASPGSTLTLNGEAVPAGSIDAGGVYALTVPLAVGSNTLALTIQPTTGPPNTITKTVVYDPSLSTADRTLVYVDAVAGITTEPSLVGTVVLDPGTNVVLGIIPNRHVRGISPLGTEVYMDDGSVFSTATGRQIRTLPLGQPIPANGFAVSPLGDYLYSRNQIVDVKSNTLLSRTLSVDIASGNAFAGPVHGGPGITPDGSSIFTGNSGVRLRQVDTAGGTSATTGASFNSAFVSDIAVSPDGNRVLLSTYAVGALYIFDPRTFQVVKTVGIPSDFVGNIGFLDDNLAVVGAAGNPHLGGGALYLVDLDLNQGQVVQSIAIPLASNLATSPEGEVFVSTGASNAVTGNRFGIDVFQLGTDNRLSLSETFFLGINRYIDASGAPVNDQIRKIVVKPGVRRPPLAVTSSDPALLYGQAVSFTATASAVGNGPVPTGSVQFMVDGANYGSAVALVDGVATGTGLGTLYPGVHVVTARYSGDANYGASSGTFFQGVGKAHLAVVADAKARAFGAANPPLTYTLAGFVDGDTSSVVGGAPVLVTTATADSGVGSYPITIGAGTLSAANYDFPADKLFAGMLTVQKSASLLARMSPADITSGVTVHFGLPVDVAALNLYDTQAGGLGIADVSLKGSTGELIAGSLLVDADGMGATFMPTGGPLAPDTYTLTIRSAANGFHDQAGALLDGDADGTPGGNFTTSFVVAAPTARVVSVPDFARGPGQPVDLPATTAGLPIRLGDGTGVTSARLVLAYDPTLLAITAAVVGPMLPVGATILLDLSTPGQAVLTLTSPTALAAGAIDLVRLTAKVPPSAPYRSAQAIRFVEVTLNGGAIAATGDAGLQLVAAFGDATGNGAYSATDANRILRIAVGLDSGLAAFPRLDPTVLLDITANGALSAADATRILQHAVGLTRPEIPPLPSAAPADMAAPTGSSSLVVTAGGPTTITKGVADDSASPSSASSTAVALGGRVDPDPGIPAVGGAISYVLAAAGSVGLDDDVPSADTAPVPLDRGDVTRGGTAPPLDGHDAVASSGDHVDAAIRQLVGHVDPDDLHAFQPKRRTHQGNGRRQGLTLSHLRTRGGLVALETDLGEFARRYGKRFTS